MSSPNQLSFLPDDYMERKSRRRTNVICAMLFIIVLGAISAAFTWTEKTIRAVEKQHTQIETQYAEAARRIEQVKQMQEKQRRMAHQAELTASLLEKVPRTYLLAEITNSLPGGVSLLDMMLDSKLITGPTLPTAKTMYEERKNQIEAEKRATAQQAQAKKYDVSVKLSGLAGTDVQVAQFINRLSRSSIFRDVNLLVIDEFTLGPQKEKLRKFQIEMMLNSEVEVKATERNAAKTAAAPVDAR